MEIKRKPTIPRGRGTSMKPQYQKQTFHQIFYIYLLNENKTISANLISGKFLNILFRIITDQSILFGIRTIGRTIDFGNSVNYAFSSLSENRFSGIRGRQPFHTESDLAPRHHALRDNISLQMNQNKSEINHKIKR